MCGIVVYLSLDPLPPSSDAPPILTALQSSNAVRGPDAQGSLQTQLDSDLTLHAYASVLHLRGSEVTPQPHRNENGDWFCWNGEVFEGLQISEFENDGKLLFSKLTSPASSITSVMASIEGPYAFAFYQKSSNTLYFARDPIGRRSLLIHKPTAAQPEFILTSAPPIESAETAYEFEEVEPDGIYAINLNDVAAGNIGVHVENLARSDQPTTYTSIPTLNQSLPEPHAPLLTYPLVPHFVPIVTRFSELLSESVRLRAQNVPSTPPGQSRLAILFSGGLDCSVLAYFADKHVPKDSPIDLLNVAFQNPRTSSNSNASSSTYSVPDRQTGLQQLAELRRVCPERVWNFVEINVPYTLSQAHRTKVYNTMHPSRTTMDFSLAQALYFLSLGSGTLLSTSQPYTTPSKILLSGLGADELLGGYIHHRTSFTHHSYLGLLASLNTSLISLPSRNLGRDDRTTSVHAREMRYPYLSLPLVHWLAGLEVDVKMDMRLEEGRGDKWLLRVLARRVGLEEASERRKRAMQFGSRSARMHNTEQDKKGNNIFMP